MSGPYVVTVARPCGCEGGVREMDAGEIECERCGGEGVLLSRRAVATLDEAQLCAAAGVTGAMDADQRVRAGRGVHWAYFTAWHEARALVAEGGKVGPLPDGTVIEVEQVDWRHVVMGGSSGQSMRSSVAISGPRGGWPAEHVRMAREDAIDEYNAAQEARA